MIKNKVFVFILLLLTLCVSCSTTRTVYLEQKIDLSDSLKILFENRPDNYQPDLPETVYEIKTVKDMELLLVATQGLMEEWQDYSYSLETYLVNLSNQLNKEK